MAESDDRVELTDLDVIARYSLAVRAATADRDELIAALRSDLDWLEGTRRRRTTAPAAHPAADAATRAPAKKAAPTRTPAKKTPAKKGTRGR